VEIPNISSSFQFATLL